MKENEREEHKHPSFGQLSFSRIQSRGTRFYGSELKQDNYIEMTLKSSEIIRDLTSDKYYEGTKSLVKVRLSMLQFSEMITSMNHAGVPCTIEQLPSGPVEELPFEENRKEFVHRKFSDRMNEFTKTLKERQQKAEKLIAKDKLSKEDKKELNWYFGSVMQEVTSNLPFFTQQFQETMDEIIVEAKTEIEGAIQHKINILGLEELHKQQKLL